MNLYLFDIDGTIAESGQIIHEEIADIFKDIKSKGHEIGLVGGGGYQKIKHQINNIDIDHIFAECGCVYYKQNDLIHIKNIRDHLLYSKINQLVKKALIFLGSVDYELSGHFIDLRHGIIYISLIGMQATQKERENFIIFDKEKKYREKLLEILHDEANNLNISSDVQITEGGSVGIAIHPKEWNKSQVVDYLENKYNKIYYFGDKYTITGNDYELLNHPRIIGIAVDSVSDTIDKLKKIYKNDVL
jgi:phosphomannomutase